MKHSLTVIIPAYNEVNNLRLSVESTLRSLNKSGIFGYEIIIITNTRRDGNHDGTPNIAEQLTKDYLNIKHVHNPAYVNLGFKFRQGVMASQKDYVTWVPGDNETSESSIADIFSRIGEADMIISYTANKEVRKLKRRVVSKCFTMLCNIMFGLNLKYYNGICIYPTKLLQSVPMSSDNFAYMAEIIVYLVKSGVSYKEVPMYIKPTNASASFKLRSMFEALGTLISLFLKIHIKRVRIDTTTKIS